jgi:hypothetical protein
MKKLARSLAILVAFSFVGCGGAGLNKAQIERLKMGMTPAEVEGMLGKGNAISAEEVAKIVNESGANSDLNTPAPGDAAPPVQFDMSEFRGVRWGGDKKNVTVIFRNDQAFRVIPVGF